MNKLSRLVPVLVLLILAPAVRLPADFLDESRADFDRRMNWWREARFGMFIHWGPYAVPAGVHRGREIKGTGGGEWIMHAAAIPVAEYEPYARQFNPTAFDADSWVRIAKDAGMRYVIITSKHHDGFCLWDSAVANYDVMDFAPIRRDLLAELKAACDRHGIRLGFYHSIMDWHHPDAQAPHFPTYNTKEKSNARFSRYAEDYMKPQLRELVTRYDPAVLWFDGEWIPEWTHEQGREIYRMVRSLKPSLIVNNRVDKGRQGSKGMNRGDRRYAGDFGTPEQEILAGISDFDWEACMTMNDNWGFRSRDHNWKSAATLVHQLVDVSAKGGNYLLNVGPTAEGLIPAASVERLAAVGLWLRTNGEAIFGTCSLRQYHEGDHIRYTASRDGNTIYAILTAWPDSAELRLARIVPEEGSEIRLLGHAGPVPWRREGKVTMISLPEAGRAASNHAWTLRVRGQEVVD